MVDFEKMNKSKKMNYAIEPIVKILLTEAVSDGGTEKKAAALEGTWIRLNEHTFAFEEADKTTLVFRDGNEAGCACKAFSDSSMNVLCEHILAFEALKSPPQLSIKSPDCQWLSGYLMSAYGWISRKGFLYPPESTEPVAEQPLVEEGDVIDEKTYSRDCKYCGEIISSTDLAQVKLDIAEHIRGCPKNPANKKKAQEPVVKESVTPEKPTVVESAPIEKPPKKEEKRVKPSTAVAKPEPRTPVVRKEMPTEAEFQATKVGRLMKSQGSIYKVSGKEVADSAAVSSYAVSAGVSTETTVLEQTAEYARATVRAYKGGRYTEGSVLIRRDAILEKLMIDLAEKNPDWIIGWSNGLPEFDLNQTVFIGDKRKILGLHIAGVVADKWLFASRDCETKAGRRAQIKILGADWREDDEVESEVEEMNTVAKRR